MSAKIAPSADEAPPAGPEASPHSAMTEFMQRHKQAIDKAYDLLQTPVDLVGHCGQMTLGGDEKEELKSWLESRKLERIPMFERLPLKLALDEANRKLQLACDIRNQSLQKVATCTEKAELFFDDAWETLDLTIDMNSWVQSKDGHDEKLATRRLGRIDWIERDLEETRYQMSFSWDGLETWMKEHEAWMAENGHSRDAWLRRLRKGEEISRINGRGRMHVPGVMIEETREEIRDEGGKLLLDTFKKTKRFSMPEKEVVTLQMHKISQIYYLPKALTNFALQAPYLHGDNVSEDLEESLNSAFRKISYDYNDFCGFQKSKLYMEGPSFVMIRYAMEFFQSPFQKLMAALFEDKFRAAPVKTMQRMQAKIKSEVKHKHHRLWKALAGGGSAGALKSQDVYNERALAMKRSEDRLTLSTMCYEINDIVRGSVTCNGEDEMLRAISLLRTNPVLGEAKFEVKKIENGHHVDNHHHQRHVKVIGALHTIVSSRPACMLVEVQLIDTVFLAVKKFQHRPHQIIRGDYGAIPVPVVVHHDGRDGEFMGHEEVLSAAVAKDATSVGSHAFEGCHSLLEISLPSSLKSLGVGSFMDCRSLIEVHLNDGLIGVGDGCFKDCRLLKTVSLPPSLESLGKQCFMQCHSLQEIDFKSNRKSLSFGEGCFSDCRDLRSIELPEGLQRLQAQCFMGCRSLEAIVLPASVSFVDGECFKNCKSLRTARILGTVEMLDEAAFFMCSSLADVSLPESLKTIGKMAFSYCKKLEKIELPSTLEKIEKMAFYYCTTLSSVKLPENIKFVDPSSFRECSSGSFSQSQMDKWRMRGLATGGAGAAASGSSDDSRKKNNKKKKKKKKKEGREGSEGGAPEPGT